MKEEKDKRDCKKRCIDAVVAEAEAEAETTS